MKRIVGIFCGVVLGAAMTASAEVRLPKMISDHAVLQRDQPVHIWGWAAPGEQVVVEMHGQRRTGEADDLGKWSVWLAPQSAGGPYELVVEGKNRLVVHDILMGDVWIASGQSNMEMPLSGFPGSAVVKNGEQEIAHADQPSLRLIRLPKRAAEYPMHDVDAAWTACTPATARDFSAVAYFFGREISQREQVPIGLVDTTWGGTPAEAWTSLEGIAEDAGLMPVFGARAEMMNEQDDMEAILARERREDAEARAANRPMPEHVWHPPAPESWAPGALYNGMIAAVTEYTIKGAIWYQGEANTGPARAGMYAQVFPALIRDWRSHWGQGDFPFLYAQISSFGANPVENWGRVRDAQRQTLSVANTAMAVTLDVGDRANVHPADKQTVGQRLALAARALAYGEDMEYSGPAFREAVREGKTLRVWFDHAQGMTCRGAADGFEVAGEDHRFVPASGRVEGESVVVSSEEMSRPVYVRYAWANAAPATLFNGSGLPAGTFTSERFAAVQ